MPSKIPRTDFARAIVHAYVRSLSHIVEQNGTSLYSHEQPHPDSQHTCNRQHVSHLLRKSCKSCAVEVAKVDSRGMTWFWRRYRRKDRIFVTLSFLLTRSPRKTHHDTSKSVPSSQSNLHACSMRRAGSSCTSCRINRNNLPANVKCCRGPRE